MRPDIEDAFRRLGQVDAEQRFRKEQQRWLKRLALLRP